MNFSSRFQSSFEFCFTSCGSNFSYLSTVSAYDREMPDLFETGCVGFGLKK